MTEYIEREAAYREICSDETMSGYEKAYCSELIRNIPSADVAPVVRCKDCKYYEIHKPKVLENCERNGYIIPMKPDDFCFYGERKDGDENG